MTASRSVAPRIEQDEAHPAPPVFPLLPFAYTAYAERCSNGYAEYMDRLARAEEKPLGSQDALALNMLSDMNQAFFSLVWAPLGAAMNRARI